MFGQAFQVGTSAMAATIQTMAGLGASQAKVMMLMMRAPAVTFDAAVGAFVGRAMPHIRGPEIRTAHGIDPALLAAYADGALDGAERMRAEAHLAGCGACRDVIALAVTASAESAVGGAYTA